MLYLCIGLGGMLGAIFRYIVSLMITPVNPGVFPLETLTINLLGCYILGLLVYLNLPVLNLNINLSLALTTGFTGSFTTFSAFSVEIMNLINGGHYIMALLYPAVSLSGGLILTGLGMLTANIINRKKALEES